MVIFQSEFTEFHYKIKLSYSDNAGRREKRDILLNKILFFDSAMQLFPPRLSREI